MQPYEDKTLVCSEESCGKDFIFPAKDQAFFASKKFGDPKRCPDCRKAKKRRMDSPFAKVRAKN